jgi:hypothetical protein
MVTLLCLIFVGQSMASSVMFYRMATMKMDTLEHSAQMRHSGHQMMASMANDTSEEDDCCAKECQCLASGCFSAYLFTKNFSSDPIVDFSTKIISNIALVPSQNPSSLFRPPILILT